MGRCPHPGTSATRRLTPKSWRLSALGNWTAQEAPPHPGPPRMRPQAPPHPIPAPSSVQVVSGVRGRGAARGRSSGGVSGLGARLLEPEPRLPQFPIQLGAVPAAASSGVEANFWVWGPLRRCPWPVHACTYCRTSPRSPLLRPGPRRFPARVRCPGWLEDTRLGRCRQPAASLVPLLACRRHPARLRHSAPAARAPGDYVRSPAPLAPTPSAPITFPTERKSRGHVVGVRGSRAARHCRLKFAGAHSLP